MAKFCTNCGKEIANGADFCSSCGANTSNKARKVVGGAPMIQKRDVALAVVLSLITCGIYGIYWFVVMTDDANRVSNDYSVSGGLALVLTIITCGIYAIFWYYNMGKKVYQAGQANGVDIADNSVLYLVLGLFGLGIVSYCLIQSDLNKFAA